MKKMTQHNMMTYLMKYFITFLSVETRMSPAKDRFATDKTSKHMSNNPKT